MIILSYALLDYFCLTLAENTVKLEAGDDMESIPVYFYTITTMEKDHDGCISTTC